MTTDTSIVPANGPASRGMTARDDFAGRELAMHAETSSAAVAAQARAAVESRYVLAMRNPRDTDDVRVRLLKECRRPGFAAVARYAKPVGGGKVEGPSIRFAEAAMRALGNLYPETTVVYDDAEKRIVRVCLTDLECNLTYSQDVVIAKTVERTQLKPGMVPLRSRTNSAGRTTYLVEATEDDLLNKQAALVSKALRGHALRVLPGDLLDEAMDVVRETLAAGDRADPDAARKKLADAFAGIGVAPTALAEYLGHDLASVSPAELADLRAVFAAIRDGETSWHATMEARRGTDDAAPAASPTQTAAAKVRERMAATKTTPKPAAREPGSDDDEPPPDDGPHGGVRPEEGHADPADAEVAAFEAHQRSQGSQASADFARDGAAWETHLATKAEPFEIASSLRKRADAFRAAGVYTQRWEAAHARIAALVGEERASQILAGKARRAA